MQSALKCVKVKKVRFSADDSRLFQIRIFDIEDEPCAPGLRANDSLSLKDRMKSVKDMKRADIL